MDLTYQGKTYAFDERRRPTYTEAVLVKTVTGGAGWTEAKLRRLMGDPDAWKAALLVAMRRAGATVNSKTDIDGDAFELPIDDGDGDQDDADVDAGEDAPPA